MPFSYFYLSVIIAPFSNLHFTRWSLLPRVKKTSLANIDPNARSQDHMGRRYGQQECVFFFARICSGESSRREKETGESGVCLGSLVKTGMVNMCRLIDHGQVLGARKVHTPEEHARYRCGERPSKNSTLFYTEAINPKAAFNVFRTSGLPVCRKLFARIFIEKQSFEYPFRSTAQIFSSCALLQEKPSCLSSRSYSSWGLYLVAISPAMIFPTHQFHIICFAKFASLRRSGRLNREGKEIAGLRQTYDFRINCHTDPHANTYLLSCFIFSLYHLLVSAASVRACDRQRYRVANHYDCVRQTNI